MSTRAERKQRRNQVLRCMNCGERGSHYIPFRLSPGQSNWLCVPPKVETTIYCTAVNWETEAVCLLEAGNHGPMHQAWAHYPGQLVVWPYVKESTDGIRT